MYEEKKRAKEAWETIITSVKQNGILYWLAKDHIGTFSNAQILELLLEHGFVSKEEYRIIKKYKVYEV